jgi:eukaryotic-like serine/threonine-protein kinase
VSLTQSTVDGRYQIVARIAAGGMGEVFRAHDAVLGREVAIKILHPQYAGDQGFVDRFRREARSAAILSHPNVVGVYDWGLTDGTYFMVMEFVRGHNLRAVLLEHGRLEAAQVVEVAVQVLAALEHAHGHGIVHRDIKPENILIAEDGTVKVADFGLARAFADSTISQAEGTVTGTVQYLAPEQIEGEPADPRTDLYAFGVVMFELLTGRTPFQGETSMAIAYKHLSERVPPPSRAAPGVSAALDATVAQATERDRERRPPSARAMREEVVEAGRRLPRAEAVARLAARIPAAEPVAAERASTVTIPRALSPRARRKRRLRMAAAVLFLAALLVGGAWATWTYAVPHYTRVPSVAGTTVKSATASLQRDGLRVTVGDPVFSRSVPAGLVVRTLPPPRARVRTGSTVTLVPSKGPQLVAVPRLTGLTEEAAAAALRAKGFVVKVTRAFDDAAAKGTVAGQSPQAGTRIEAGSEVTISVSRGPELVRLPDVHGQAAGVATATLQSLQLQVTSIEDFSVDVARGSVIRTDPPAGESVPKGASVTIVVSKGPRTFAMISVIGLASADASAKLGDLGLVVREVQVPGSIGDTVVGQEPAAGQTVEQGANVTIFIGG